MKFTKLLGVGTFLIFIFSNFTKDSIPTEHNVLEVYFSNKLDISELSKIKSALFKDGVNLNYDCLKFNANGKLSTIEYHVTTEKFAGGDKTDYTVTEIGFIINTNPNAKYGIIIGAKDVIKKRKKALDKQD